MSLKIIHNSALLQSFYDKPPTLHKLKTLRNPTGVRDAHSAAHWDILQKAAAADQVLIPICK